MPIEVTSHAQGMYKSLELEATVWRACRRCGEANPSLVECPRCHTLNQSGVACRKCKTFMHEVAHGWTTCPKCGQPGIKEELGVIAAWYKNPLKRWVFALRQMFKRRSL